MRPLILDLNLIPFTSKANPHNFDLDCADETIRTFISFSISWCTLQTRPSRGLYVGPDASARMRQPWALEDPSTLAGILERAGLDQIEVSQHTRTACFVWRDDFARRLVLATPLASTFSDAPDDRQQ